MSPKCISGSRSVLLGIAHSSNKATSPLLNRALHNTRTNSSSGIIHKSSILSLRAASAPFLAQSTRLAFSSAAISANTQISSSSAAVADNKKNSGVVAQKDEEPIQGSMPSYNRHLVICTGVKGNDWVKKPELSDPYLNLLSTVVRGQEVKVNFVDEVSDPILTGTKDHVNVLPTKGPRHDLILFPDNIKFKNIRYEAFKDLARYLEQHPVGTLRPAVEQSIAATHKGSHENNAGNDGDTSLVTELVPGSGELITIELVKEPSAVMVCVHGARDCRCGEQGNEFYQILKDMVQVTGLSSSIKIYGVSHIGGHKYAPNTIMYPSGDWHGRLSEKDSVDAQQVLFDALASGGMAASVREKKEKDPIMLDRWRGRIGLSKQEQIELYERALAKQKQRQQTISSSTVSPSSLFSAPGEDLYEDDGLKDQPTALSIDSEKSSAVPSTTTTTTTQKVKIVFETYQNVRTEIEAKVGERILDIVKDKDPSRHGVYQALECTCGGQLECATCHVYIELPFHARLPAVTDAEEDMLEYAVGRKESSRLGCQIKIQPELEGMVVKLPR
ncbi:hypothetical protein EDD11_005238, partial [Mortierella claussenii]